MSSLEQTAKTKLIQLVQAIEPVVAKQLEGFTAGEIEYVVSNFKQNLSYDLARDFEKLRVDNLKESPFDDLLND